MAGKTGQARQGRRATGTELRTDRDRRRGGTGTELPHFLHVGGNSLSPQPFSCLPCAFCTPSLPALLPASWPSHLPKPLAGMCDGVPSLPPSNMHRHAALPTYSCFPSSASSCSLLLLSPRKGQDTAYSLGMPVYVWLRAWHAACAPLPPPPPHCLPCPSCTKAKQHSTHLCALLLPTIFSLWY